MSKSNYNREIHYRARQKYINSVPSGIYKIKNLKTGEFYIGASVKPVRRITEHFTLSKKKDKVSPHLHNSLLEFGKSNFIWGMLEYCPENNLLEREQYWINKLKPKYNA
jgi:group I intron endonuclease